MNFLVLACVQWRLVNTKTSHRLLSDAFGSVLSATIPVSTKMKVSLVSAFMKIVTNLSFEQFLLPLVGGELIMIAIINFKIFKFLSLVKNHIPVLYWVLPYEVNHPTGFTGATQNKIKWKHWAAKHYSG